MTEIYASDGTPMHEVTLTVKLLVREDDLVQNARDVRRTLASRKALRRLLLRIVTIGVEGPGMITRPRRTPPTGEEEPEWHATGGLGATAHHGALLGHEPDEEEDDYKAERYVLTCGKRTKSGRACQRFIVGLYDGGETGSFWHPKLGTCDMRNKEWRCWQHGDVTERGSPPDGNQRDTTKEDTHLDLPAGTPGAYGDGLHHTHQCPTHGTTFPCRAEHRQGTILTNRDVIGLCPYQYLHRLNEKRRADASRV